MHTSPIITGAAPARRWPAPSTSPPTAGVAPPMPDQMTSLTCPS
jgi:hypothetical protein